MTHLPRPSLKQRSLKFCPPFSSSFISHVELEIKVKPVWELKEEHGIEIPINILFDADKKEQLKLKIIKFEEFQATVITNRTDPDRITLTETKQG